MKKVVVAFILSLTFASVKGQDLIITTEFDTIFCRIVHVSPSFIHYEQLLANRTIAGRNIPMEQVWEYYYYSQRRGRSSSSAERDKAPYRRWKIGLQGGGAYLTGSVSESKKQMRELGIPQSQIDDFHKKLRNGAFVGLDVHYLLTRFFGVGLRYSLFTSSINMDFSLRDPTVSLPIYYSMGLNEKIYVNYIGPSVIFQHWLGSGQKFSLSEEISLGYAHYRDEVRYDPYQFVLFDTYNTLTEGHTMGGGLKVAFEYYPSPHISFAANAGLFVAPFYSVKISAKDMTVKEKLDSKNFLNMSRADYSLGVRFHF
jgi:hypothetical protein